MASKLNRSDDYLGVGGNVVNGTKDTEQPYEEPEEMNASLVGDIDIGLHTDKRGPRISGMSLLSDNLLVLADSDNKCIKLVDIQSNILISSLKLTGKPWDITEMQSGKLVVTVPHKKTLQYLGIQSTQMSAGQKLKVKGNCYGVLFNQAKLIVTFENPDKIEIMEVDGTVVWTMNMWGRHVDISPDNSTLYIANTTAVASVTLDDHVTYTGSNAIKNPNGLTVDQHGYIYVCSYNPCKIYRLNPDCSLDKVLHLWEDKYLIWPESVVYSKHEDKLYIGSVNTAAMKVFRIQ